MACAGTGAAVAHGKNLGSALVGIQKKSSKLVNSTHIKRFKRLGQQAAVFGWIHAWFGLALQVRLFVGINDARTFTVPVERKKAKVA